MQLTVSAFQPDASALETREVAECAPPQSVSSRIIR